MAASNRRADSAARFRANRSRALRERSHGNGASTAMRRRRMRRSADARGKCKYVKARPEFSYSRCPSPPAAFPTLPPLPIASRLPDATTSLPFPRGTASLPLPPHPRPCVCIYLRPREQHARTHTYVPAAQVHSRARVCT